MDKDLYCVLVHEFEDIAEYTNYEDEVVYTEEGIKRTLDWIKDNTFDLYQVIDEWLEKAYQRVNS